MIPPTVPPAPSVAPAPPQIDAYQPGASEGSGIGQAFTAAVDGFGARSAEMQASLSSLAARDMAAVGEVGTVASPGVGHLSAAHPAGPQPGGAPGPLAIMLDSFNFAIEASLLSRAATQLTGRGPVQLQR